MAVCLPPAPAPAHCSTPAVTALTANTTRWEILNIRNIFILLYEKNISDFIPKAGFAYNKYKYNFNYNTTLMTPTSNGFQYLLNVWGIFL